MRKPSRLQEFMTHPTDRGLTFLLVLLFGLLFIVQPFFLVKAFGRFVAESILSLFILFAATAVPRPRLRRVVFGLAALAIITRWLVYVSENESLVAFHATLEILFVWLAFYGLVLRVFSRGRITRRQIEGAVPVYLLIGLVFADMYFLLELFQAGAFDFGGDGTGGLRRIAADFNYFSFVTLTTVGFGDILPLSAGARQLTVLGGLIGQLFPAVLLARLVSMEITSAVPAGSAGVAASRMLSVCGCC